MPCENSHRLAITGCLVSGTPSRIIRSNDQGFSFRYDNFLKGTSFEQAYDLYLFDKKLKLLMMDALERIEIHIRSIIAHDVGRKDPLGYKNPDFIKQRFLSDDVVSTYDKWLLNKTRKFVKAETTVSSDTGVSRRRSPSGSQ